MGDLFFHYLWQLWMDSMRLCGQDLCSLTLFRPYCFIIFIIFSSHVLTGG